MGAEKNENQNEQSVNWEMKCKENETYPKSRVGQVDSFFGKNCAPNWNYFTLFARPERFRGYFGQEACLISHYLDVSRNCKKKETPTDPNADWSHSKSVYYIP
jgi:hypothetical protein